MYVSVFFMWFLTSSYMIIDAYIHSLINAVKESLTPSSFEGGPPQLKFWTLDHWKSNFKCFWDCEMATFSFKTSQMQKKDLKHAGLQSKMYIVRCKWTKSKRITSVPFIYITILPSFEWFHLCLNSWKPRDPPKIPCMRVSGACLCVCACFVIKKSDFCPDFFFRFSAIIGS